eukprot:UN10457
MEASWNYIAPSRTQVIQWIIEAWEGPKSKVTIGVIKKGARLCYIDSSVDEAISAWDNCKKPEDLTFMIERKKSPNCQKRNVWYCFMYL